MYDAFSKGDVAAVLASMDANIHWQEPASLPFEDQRGPQAVAENIFGPLISQIERFTVTANEVFDAGDVVFTIGIYGGTGANTGTELNAEFVHVWRFGPDGKITGFRTYTDTHLWRQALGVQ